MGTVKDAVIAGIYKRAMRIDRTKAFPGTKKIGLVIRTGGLEHETIKYLVELAERYKGKFSITGDRTGRQLFSAMITIEDDPKAPAKSLLERDSVVPSTKMDPCPECFRIYQCFGPATDARQNSPIPDHAKFKSVRDGSEFYLHLSCADMMKLPIPE